MHSIVYVLLPPTVSDVVGETDRLLAKYNSDSNESGKWDDWFPLKYFKPTDEEIVKWGKKLASSVRPVTQMSEKDYEGPACLVTPDGKWHDIRDFGYKLILQYEQGIHGLHPENVEPVSKWRALVRETISRHPDHLIFVLDCHS